MDINRTVLKNLAIFKIKGAEPLGEILNLYLKADGFKVIKKSV